VFWRHNIEFQLLLCASFDRKYLISVCLFVFYYIISLFMLSPFLFLSPSLPLASLRSAVLSVGMIFTGLLFHIRISSGSWSGRGIFCPLLSAARPSRPLACLGGHSAHKGFKLLFCQTFFSDTILLALFH